MPRKAITKTCHYCGSVFTSVNRIVRFCSPGCGIHFRLVQTPTPTITKDCAQCGAQFSHAAIASMASRKFCSPRCALDHLHESSIGNQLVRFWSYVDKRGDDECWPWKGAKDKDGYGLARWNNKQYRAHRVAFEIAHGSIDPVLEVHHACDNPPCCNPKCLSQGTQLENSRQMVERGRAMAGDRSPTRRFPERYPRGEKQHLAKLTEEAVREIRARHACGGISFGALGREFGVTEGAIRLVVQRKNWKHVE